MKFAGGSELMLWCQDESGNPTIGSSVQYYEAGIDIGLESIVMPLHGICMSTKPFI